MLLAIYSRKLHSAKNVKLHHRDSNHGPSANWAGVLAAVDESYTIAQRLAHMPGKQKVPGSNPGGAA